MDAKRIADKYIAPDGSKPAPVVDLASTSEQKLAGRPPMTFPENWSGFGPKMLALKERERKFVWAYLLNGMTDGRESAAQAARDAGYPDPGPHSASVRVAAHHLMHRDAIIEAMQEVAGRELRGLVLPAVLALGRMIAKDGHQDQRHAALAVLDRTGHGARTSVDVNVNGSVTVNHTAAAVEDLRRLIALGASDEKLLEVFGHSGLERYRKLLASENAKLIEHREAE